MSCNCDGACDSVVRRSRRAVRLLVLRFVISSLLFAMAFLVPSDKGSYIFIISWFLSGYTVLFSAIHGLRNKKIFDENFLMSIATIGAFATGQWSEGAAVMLFFNLGEMIQESAVNRSRTSIEKCLDIRSNTARIHPDGSIVHPSQVAIGSLVMVLPGERVPLDGLLVEGSSSFDTSAITGESIPRDLVAGDEVLSGFVNGQHPALIRTTALYSDSTVSRMLALIEGAASRKAKTERLITSFARVYTPIVTIAALLVALVPPVLASLVAGNVSLFSTEFSRWGYRALVFLVISCPCAFVISVPLGYFGGIGGAARRGILVKGAQALDGLVKVKAVVFDKTGTLSEGRFSVTALSTAPSVSEQELLATAASIEKHSNHPIARAIVSHVTQKYPDSHPNSSVNPSDIAGSVCTERPGYGLVCGSGANRVAAGTKRLMDELGVSVGGLGDEHTRVYVSRGSDLLGCIVLSDRPKKDAFAAVAQLRSLGVSRIALISGDSASSAHALASEVGIMEVYSGVLPDEKVHYFEQIAKDSEQGSAIFVGDGINDAPVIARADVGIAMGGIGSDAAIEAADLVIMNDNPRSVPEAIRLARYTRSIVYQNIAFAFAVKLIFLILGAFGIATLWEAVFADVGVALIATANALRARSSRIPGDKR